MTLARHLGQASKTLPHEKHTHWWPHGTKRWLDGSSRQTTHSSGGAFAASASRVLTDLLRAGDRDILNAVSASRTQEREGGMHATLALVALASKVLTDLLKAGDSVILMVQLCSTLAPVKPISA